MAKQTVSPLELLETLSLDEIRQQIAEKEQELEQLLAERRKFIDGLRVLERALDVLRNGKPARKKAEHASRGAGGRGADRNAERNSGVDETQSLDDVRLKISDYLTEQGPQSGTAIREALGLDLAEFKLAVDHEWFKRTGAGAGTRYANANVQD